MYLCLCVVLSADRNYNVLSPNFMKRHKRQNDFRCVFTKIFIRKLLQLKIIAIHTPLSAATCKYRKSL